ncbi:MAG: hypothetical protein HYV09_31780 [Deltaproteobacteria bacterium]|nr:hypothetical protein [Deltaproteobacteria bacterium]
MASRAVGTTRDSGAPGAPESVRRAPRADSLPPRAESLPPRAKSLPPRDPRVTPATWRALERYGEALASFEGALADRTGLGRIDARYADLAAAAEQVVRALLADRSKSSVRWMPAALDAGLEAYALEARSPGERPEDDIAFAEHALRAARSLARPGPHG